MHKNYNKYQEFGGYWLTQLPAGGKSEWKFELINPPHLFDNTEHNFADEVVPLPPFDSEIDYKIDSIEFLDKTTTKTISQHESALGCTFNKREGILQKTDFIAAGFSVYNCVYTLPKIKNRQYSKSKTLNRQHKSKIIISQQSTSKGTARPTTQATLGSIKKTSNTRAGNKQMDTISHNISKVAGIQVEGFWLDEVFRHNKEEWMFQKRNPGHCLKTSYHGFKSVESEAFVYDDHDDDEIKLIRYLDKSVSRTVLEHENKLGCIFNKREGVITSFDFVDAGFSVNFGMYTIPKVQNVAPIAIKEIKRKTSRALHRASHIGIKSQGTLAACSRTITTHPSTMSHDSKNVIKLDDVQGCLKQDLRGPYKCQSSDSEIKKGMAIATKSNTFRSVERFWLDELSYGGSIGRRKFRKILPGKYVTSSGKISACILGQDSDEDDNYEIERIVYLDRTYTESVTEHEQELGCTFKKKEGVITKQSFLDAGFLVYSGIYSLSSSSATGRINTPFGSPNLDNSNVGTEFYFEVSIYNEYPYTICQPLICTKKVTDKTSTCLEPTNLQPKAEAINVPNSSTKHCEKLKQYEMQVPLTRGASGTTRFKNRKYTDKSSRAVSGCTSKPLPKCISGAEGYTLQQLRTDTERSKLKKIMLSMSDTEDSDENYSVNLLGRGKKRRRIIDTSDSSDDEQCGKRIANSAKSFLK